LGDVTLRPYRDADLEAALDLWRRAWDATVPEINFGNRLDWWRKRWTEELVPKNTITMAEIDKRLIGFVVVDPKSGYLDQIVVDPASWGSGIANVLLSEAKRQSSKSVMLDVNQSNARAIRFYEREGFIRGSEGKNPLSGKPTWHYVWNA
jgi:putative acetyltransferase